MGIIDGYDLAYLLIYYHYKTHLDLDLVNIYPKCNKNTEKH